MMTPNRLAAMIGLGMLIANISAIASPTMEGSWDNPQRSNSQFLITMAPTLSSMGVSYGARVICGADQAPCIASAQIRLTLTDGEDRVLHAYEGEYSPTTPGTTWKVVANTPIVDAGTFCTSAEILIERPDGSTQRLTSQNSPCTVLD